MTQKSVLINKNNGDSTAIKIDEVSASLVGPSSVLQPAAVNQYYYHFLSRIVAHLAG